MRRPSSIHSQSNIEELKLPPSHEKLNSLSYIERMEEASRFLRGTLKTTPITCTVLGSGLCSNSSILDSPLEIPFEEIPCFIPPSVEGHSGSFTFGTIGGRPHLVQKGRLHLYEGHKPHDVVFPLQVAANLGIKNFLLTSATGSLDKEISPGSVVVLSNILAGQTPDPFIEVQCKELGTLFSDCTHPFDNSLSAQAADLLSTHGIAVYRGTFSWMMGPRYDSAAEIADLQARSWIVEHILKKPELAPKVVGMSMAPEVISLNHLGGRSVVGISYVSNYAAGVSATPLRHEDVLAAGERFSRQFGPALRDLLNLFS